MRFAFLIFVTKFSIKISLLPIFQSLMDRVSSFPFFLSLLLFAQSILNSSRDCSFEVVVVIRVYAGVCLLVSVHLYHFILYFCACNLRRESTTIIQRVLIVNLSIIGIGFQQNVSNFT
ncbi:hypothetical protein HPP92_027263 [Vanilla planifolia]|uniref:Uncharacterized protein n=1 Tax=Vanilla planifolia TaxID=51239 RepID=A0A835U8A3_VANPL|nr:hypothetical protein HPP92_027263 [Vanilla planifolia]